MCAHAGLRAVEARHGTPSEAMPNRFVTAEVVEEWLGRIAKRTHITDIDPIRIRDLRLYRQAFVHKNYFRDPQPADEAAVFVPPDSNERMEFLGDSVIYAVVGLYLYRRFGEDEGFLTDLRIKLVRSEQLARWALGLGFPGWLVLPASIEDKTDEAMERGRYSQKLLENAFEAFIGAVMLDLGFDVANRFLSGLIESTIDFVEMIVVNDNFKDSLIRYTNARKWRNPVFVDVFPHSVRNAATHESQVTEYGGKTTCVVALLPRAQVLEADPALVEYERKVLGIIHKTAMATRSALTRYDEIVARTDDIIVGLGFEKNVRKAEQLASKYALMNLKVKLNY